MSVKLNTFKITSGSVIHEEHSGVLGIRSVTARNLPVCSQLCLQMCCKYVNIELMVLLTGWSHGGEEENSQSGGCGSG